MVSPAILLQDIQHDQIAALIDPFGTRAFDLVTRYWTVAEKNGVSVGFQGLLLWNRLLWIGIGCLVFAAAYARFSFAERSTKPRPIEADAEEAIARRMVSLAPPTVARCAMDQICRLVQDPLHGHGKKYILCCDCRCLTPELHSQSCH